MTNSTTIDKDAEFYKAFGEAITRWQYVESALCEVFIGVSGNAHPEVAAAVFYTPESFYTKWQLTHNAARLWLKGELLKEWKALKTRLKDESEVRNVFIHSITQRVGRHVENMEPDSLFITQDPWNPNSVFKAQAENIKRSYTTDEINEIIRIFNILREDLLKFAIKIRPDAIWRQPLA